MGKQILRLLKNNKLVVVFLYFTFIVYSCKNNKEREMIIHNQNGLSGHLEQIIECFIEEYNVQGKSFYIFEGYPKIEHKLPIPRIDIDKYVYISIVVYDQNPEILENQVLYSTELNNYTLFYSKHKDREMAISNNLIWRKVIPFKDEEYNSKEYSKVIDHIDTEFLYNKEENVIELSNFKSESCKGRLDDKYEW